MRILVTGGAGFIGANPSPSCCVGHGARETARDLEGTPDGYAASVRRLVEQVLAET